MKWRPTSECLVLMKNRVGSKYQEQGNDRKTTSFEKPE